MASIEYAVRATDLASTVFAKIALSADGLDQQLEDLGKRVAEPEVDLKDAAFTQGMIRCAERIDKLSAKMAEPGVDLSDTKFQAEILKINAQLDRLDRRHVTATVDVNVDRSAWSRLRGMFGGGGGGLGGLFGGAGGAAGAGAQTGSGGLAALGPYAQGGAIGLAGILAAALGPALLPLGIGGLAGGGGLLGAFAAGSSANKQLQQLQTALASAKGPQKKDLQQQIKQLQGQDAGVLGFYGAAQGVFGTGKQTLLGALSAQGPGFSGGAGAPSFLTGMGVILKQIQGFIKSIGPSLGDMFRASVPFVQMFVKLLEQAGKILMPVFTQAMQQMIPFLPLMSKGLLLIVQGLAGMIKALGPGGMKASAEIFIGLSKAMEVVLIGVGHAMNWLAVAVMDTAHFIRTHWDIIKWIAAPFAVAVAEVITHWKTIRHETAVIFDGVRHDIAHTWDQIFSNTIGTVIRLVHNVETQYNSLRHGIASAFDDIRHDVAAAWDTIWRNTVTRAQNGIDDVIRWFKSLPGRALNALFGFGHSLYAFAHAALTDFLSGLQSVGGTVLHWLRDFIGGIPSAIMHFLHMSPPHAGSVFYDLGANMMRHLEAGIKQGARGAVNAAQDAFRAARGGPGGPGTHAAMPYLESLWRGAGGPPGLAHLMAAIAMAESGGNPAAYNPSGATGLWQILGAVDPRDQPFLRNPQVNAHEAVLKWRTQGLGAWVTYTSGAYKAYYDQGGWLPPGVSLAVNATGRPERVLGPGEGGNITINVSVSPLASPADTGRKVAEVLAEFKKRGGWVYKPAGF